MLPDKPTEILPATPSGIARAADLLRAGGIVAFPTETVYGLGADAGNDAAVARVFQAKGRPGFNPLIVHVADLDAARRIAVFDEVADRLAEAFWPGPLTLVLPLCDGAPLSPRVTAGLFSVAIRIPAHPLARALLKAAGCPIAAPSANLSGRISPTRPAHVLADLGGRIDAVLAGGDCAVGVESTIVGLVGPKSSLGPASSFDGVTLLRPGGIAAEALEACLGYPLAAQTAPPSEPTYTPNSPGQLASHYAPHAPLRLNASTPRPGEIWIGFGPDFGADFGLGFGMGPDRLSAQPKSGLNLSSDADLAEAAANLFHLLHEADRLADQGQTIAIARIPHYGLGQAINDRLRRAAAR